MGPRMRFPNRLQTLLALVAIFGPKSLAEAAPNDDPPVFYDYETLKKMNVERMNTFQKENAKGLMVKLAQMVVHNTVNVKTQNKRR